MIGVCVLLSPNIPDHISIPVQMFKDEVPEQDPIEEGGEKIPAVPAH